MYIIRYIEVLHGVNQHTFHWEAPPTVWSQIHRGLPKKIIPAYITYWHLPRCLYSTDMSSFMHNTHIYTVPSIATDIQISIYLSIYIYVYIYTTILIYNNNTHTHIYIYILCIRPRRWVRLNVKILIESFADHLVSEHVLPFFFSFMPLVTSLIVWFETIARCHVLAPRSWGPCEIVQHLQRSNIFNIFNVATSSTCSTSSTSQHL